MKSIILTILLLQSCRQDNNQYDNLTYQLCEIINVVHESYPFHINTIKNSCGLLNQSNLHYPENNPISEIKVVWSSDILNCGKLKFLLLEDRDEFRKYEYLYYTSIHFKFLSDDNKKVRMRRITDEFFDRPGVGVGIDFSTSENYYMSKINGKWIIDSLVHDIKL